MLVVFTAGCINLNNVHNFWCSDHFNQTEGFYIKFSDNAGIKFSDDDITPVRFKSREARDEAYKNIILTYSAGQKAYAITGNELYEKAKEENGK